MTLLKMKTEIAEAKLTSDKKLVKPHLLEADNEHGRDLAFQGVEEEEIDIRLHNLVTKEKEVDDKQMNLEKKEREFLTREERLVVRERVEAQKLLDDRKLLDSQKQEFELRTKKERKSFEDDIKDKMDALELKKCEISYKEEENLIREHTLESRMEKLKDKEKEIDTKLRLLTEREESANKESQKLKDEKEQLAVDIKKLETSKAELESSRTAINAEKQQIIRQKENLKLAQIEVKQETVDCGIMKNSIMKETEELTHEKIKFDREMKSLYEKGTSLATEREQLNNDKEAFNVWRYIEEEKLKNESLKMRVYIQQDAEELRMKEAALEKERSVFSLELESKMKVLEEMEEKLQEKRNDIERVKVMNQKIVKSPNFVDESNSPEMKMDQDRLTREEIDISAKRRKLDIDQFETRNIETVQMHMGDEQEEFIEERDHFLPAVDQCNICKNRGVKIDDLCSIELQTPSRTATKRNIVIEKHIDGCDSTLGSKSVGLSRHLPFLQKCSMPFNSSLRDTGRHPIDGISSEHTSLVGFETKTENSPDRANSEIQYRKRGRPKTTKRRNSVRAVVNDPKAIPGDISKEKGQQTSDRAEVFVVIDEGSQRDSENVSAGEGHSKCQNDAPGTPISGEKRYNFRLSTINRRFWK